MMRNSLSLDEFSSENETRNFCFHCKYQGVSLNKIFADAETCRNRPFAVSHSRGTKPPRWRTKVVLGQNKQKTYIILNGNFLCLSCPSATFALQHGGFVPPEWLTEKGLFNSTLSFSLFSIVVSSIAFTKRTILQQESH